MSRWKGRGIEGWTRTLNSVEEHYFVAGESLCGLWWSSSGPFKHTPDLAAKTCTRCRRRLAEKRGVRS